MAATLIIKNTTAAEIFIDDVGTNVPSSGQVDIDDRANLLKMARSDSLRQLVVAGTVILNDGFTDLSVPEALEYLDTIWSNAGSGRLPIIPMGFVAGARMNWLDVNRVSVGEPGERSICADARGGRPLTWIGTLVADMSVSGPGGIQAGSVEAPNTWYRVLVIGDAQGINPPAALLVPQGVPFNERGYEIFRRVGFIRNGNASQILKFGQLGNARSRFVLYDEDAPLLTLVSDGAATAPTTVSLESLVPPIGRSQVLMGFGFRTSGGAATDQLLIRPNGSTTTSPITRIAPGALVAQKLRNTGWIFTNGAQEIQYAVSNVADRADLAVAGYIDEI